MSYENSYDESINTPEIFWARAAKEIEWDQPYRLVLDDSRTPFTRWFVGGELNTGYNSARRFYMHMGPAVRSA